MDVHFQKFFSLFYRIHTQLFDEFVVFCLEYSLDDLSIRLDCDVLTNAMMNRISKKRDMYGKKCKNLSPEYKPQ